jgi:hypothetical protein
LRASSNGTAIFACSAADDFFEALQFDAAIPENRLYVYNQPHIFALARLQDQYPRYAVLLADTNAGRVFTFGLGRTLNEDGVSNTKMRDMTEVGRWSRAKEDSRADNYLMQHSVELIEQLNDDRSVRGDRAHILAGDDVVLPTFESSFRHISPSESSEHLRSISERPSMRSGPLLTPLCESTIPRRTSNVSRQC